MLLHQPCRKQEVKITIISRLEPRRVGGRGENNQRLSGNGKNDGVSNSIVSPVAPTSEKLSASQLQRLINHSTICIERRDTLESGFASSIELESHNPSFSFYPDRATNLSPSSPNRQLSPAAADLFRAPPHHVYLPLVRRARL